MPPKLDKRAVECISDYLSALACKGTTDFRFPRYVGLLSSTAALRRVKNRDMYKKILIKLCIRGLFKFKKINQTLLIKKNRYTCQHSTFYEELFPGERFFQRNPS